MRIYLAGCGKIGLRLGSQLAANGQQVMGWKRQAIAADFPIHPIDLQDAAAVQQLTPDADIIVFTVTPSEFSDSGYRQVYETILEHVIDFAKRHKQPPLVILVSSTGVYGQQNGEWVNEDSPTEPSGFSGRWVLRGEQRLREQLDSTLSVRFSGIYGEGRTRLIRQAYAQQSIQKSPPIWTNRIHESDCVAALYFLIQQVIQGQRLDSVYLVSDDMPVSSYEVRLFICQQLGLPLPPEKTTNLSDNTNKRCDNQRIKQLGFTLRYPSYQSGYSEIITASEDVGMAF